VARHPPHRPRADAEVHRHQQLERSDRVPCDAAPQHPREARHRAERLQDLVHVGHVRLQQRVPLRLHKRAALVLAHSLDVLLHLTVAGVLDDSAHQRGGEARLRLGGGGEGPDQFREAVEEEVLVARGEHELPQVHRMLGCIGVAHRVGGQEGERELLVARGEDNGVDLDLSAGAELDSGFGDGRDVGTVDFDTGGAHLLEEGGGDGGNLREETVLRAQCVRVLPDEEVERLEQEGLVERLGEPSQGCAICGASVGGKNVGV
jgi:hypothetical protein